MSRGKPVTERNIAEALEHALSVHRYGNLITLEFPHEYIHLVEWLKSKSAKAALESAASEVFGKKCVVEVVAESIPAAEEFFLEAKERMSRTTGLALLGGADA